MHPILKQLDGEIPKEQTMNVSDANDQSPMLNIVDSDRLLFSVFSLLQKLGADERPEVGNMSFKSIFLFILCEWFLNLAYGGVTNFYISHKSTRM